MAASAARWLTITATTASSSLPGLPGWLSARAAGEAACTLRSAEDAAAPQDKAFCTNQYKSKQTLKIQSFKALMYIFVLFLINSVAFLCKSYIYIFLFIC